MVPALEVSPAAPSELPVSTAAPLKDRQTDIAALLGLPREDPIDRGFLAPHSWLPALGLSSAFHSAVFSPLWKCEALNRARLLLCTGGQQKVYFCIILREFEVGFLS